MTTSQITDGRPTPEEAVVAVIQDEAQRNHGALPVRVLKHDKARNSVDVEILIRLMINGAPREMPPAVDIPIQWLSSAAGHAMTVPLLKGALGWITPAGGDVSSWFASATAQADDPEAGRFDLSNSIFEAGSRPFTNPLPASAFSDTDGVLSGPWQVGDNAASKKAALNGDNCPAAGVGGVPSAMALWMSQVEAAINVLAPGAVFPLSATFNTVAIATVTATATKLRAK